MERKIVMNGEQSKRASLLERVGTPRDLAARREIEQTRQRKEWNRAVEAHREFQAKKMV